jgi:uncharacterized protein YndB with AHSA1/START domain
VFRAFVDPELLVRWFAPDGCRCVIADIDPEPGGRHRTVVETPDGTRHTTLGEFVEFVAGVQEGWRQMLDRVQTE